MMSKKRVMELAIQGLELEKAKVEAEMAGIQRMLADLRDGKPRRRKIRRSR